MSICERRDWIDTVQRANFLSCCPFYFPFLMSLNRCCISYDFSRSVFDADLVPVYEALKHHYDLLTLWVTGLCRKPKVEFHTRLVPVCTILTIRYPSGIIGLGVNVNVPPAYVSSPLYLATHNFVEHLVSVPVLVCHDRLTTEHHHHADS
jgi:hypothetical protein